MAKRGTKPALSAEKRARGTLRPSRDTFAALASTSNQMTMAPPELPYAVALVWDEYVSAAVAHGALQCDADAFALWCEMAANLRQARALTGTSDQALPPAAYLQQWRTLGELFGLAGPKSRVYAKLGGDGAANPFKALSARRGQPE